LISHLERDFANCDVNLLGGGRISPDLLGKDPTLRQIDRALAYKSSDAA
jgi:hypothetical protein